MARVGEKSVAWNEDRDLLFDVGAPLHWLTLVPRPSYDRKGKLGSDEKVETGHHRSVASSADSRTYPCHPEPTYSVESNISGSGPPRVRRVMRGGSYRNPAQRCRSAYRNIRDPRNEIRNQGFRVLLSSAPNPRPRPARPSVPSRPAPIRGRRPRACRPFS